MLQQEAINIHMTSERKNPQIVDFFITDICHCRFISLITAYKNAYTAVFVINYSSSDSGNLKAFIRMPFS